MTINIQTIALIILTVSVLYLFHRDGSQQENIERQGQKININERYMISNDNWFFDRIEKNQ